jgi:hypothetical protein
MMPGMMGGMMNGMMGSMGNPYGGAYAGMNGLGGSGMMNVPGAYASPMMGMGYPRL